MSIEVVPQPRIDHLVTGLDGEPLRRTDYRGIAWFGGRQHPPQGGLLAMTMQTAGIVSPFWLPDSLAYQSSAVADIQVSLSVGLIYVPENCAIAEASARLAVNEAHPEASHVLLHLQGAARIPIGVSYSVTVLAPPDVAHVPG
jgi:hypothetical protein